MINIVLTLLTLMVAALALVPIITLRKFAKRHEVSVDEIFNVALARFALHPGLHVLGAVVLGGLAYALVRMLTWSEWAGFIAMVAVPFWAAVRHASHKVADVRTEQYLARLTLETSLGHLDCFWLHVDASIALNVERKQFACVTQTQNEAKPIELARIKNALAVSPELNQIKVLGATGIEGLDARSDAARENLKAQLAHQKATGLLLELDDIQTPQIHITMPLAGAQQWLVLIDQMRRGVAKPNATAQQLPAA